MIAGVFMCSFVKEIDVSSIEMSDGTDHIYNTIQQINHIVQQNTVKVTVISEELNGQVLNMGIIGYFMLGIGSNKGHFDSWGQTVTTGYITEEPTCSAYEVWPLVSENTEVAIDLAEMLKINMIENMRSFNEGGRFILVG